MGDSKRAMDEYTADIFMGGVQTIVMHNTCEDSYATAGLEPQPSRQGPTHSLLRTACHSHV